MSSLVMTEQEQAQSRLQREVEYFLSTLKSKDEFIFNKVLNSKEFKAFKAKFDKETPSLFSYDNTGIGQGLFA